MTNERERQTYYGALDYGSKEFIVKAYATGNSENTVDFLKYLQSLRPNQKISVIWALSSLFLNSLPMDKSLAITHFGLL